MSRVIIAYRGLSSIMRPAASGFTILIKPVRRLGKVINSSQTWIAYSDFDPRFFHPKRGMVNQPLRLKKMPFDYPLVTGTEHWRRKMRTVFRGLDSNGDGLVTKEDYVKSAQRAAQYLNLNEKQARAQLDLRLAIWRIVNAKDDEDGMEPVVTEEEYINRRIETFNDRQFRQEMYPVILSVEFSTMDTNGDGLISHEEFAAYCCGFNIPTGYSKKMFDILDVNNDGVISIEEFGQGHVDFWLGEDPNSKYSEFIGPLVD